jgi:hypothetical protein
VDLGVTGAEAELGVAEAEATAVELGVEAEVVAAGGGIVGPEVTAVELGVEAEAVAVSRVWRWSGHE